MSSASTYPYVATLDLRWADKLLEELQHRGCEISTPPYTLFFAKKKGLNCTLYQSGKLVVQGKECYEFVEFYLEPEILKTFGLSHNMDSATFTPHIGIDESGKGDFFGPLCIAGVYLKSEDFQILKSLGVKDSKSLNDIKIAQIAPQIQQRCLCHIVTIKPLKYNQIYESFKNLNSLLAWGHATAIEHLVEKSGCQYVVIDQFAHEQVVKRALDHKKLIVTLSQRHRAEDDLAVAAASILARYAFIEGLRRLSEEVGIELPKGSSKTAQVVGLKILNRLGEAALKSVCKQHFKTFSQILEYSRNFEQI